MTARLFCATSNPAAACSAMTFSSCKLGAVSDLLKVALSNTGGASGRGRLTQTKASAIIAAPMTKGAKLLLISISKQTSKRL